MSHEGQFLVVIFIGAILFIWAMFQNRAIDEMLLDSTSCDGIGHFYHAEGLIKDASWIRNITTYNRTLLPRTPEDYYRYGGSCSSTAKAVMCLCNIYNATCKYYYNVAPVAHVGVIYEPDEKQIVKSDMITLA